MEIMNYSLGSGPHVCHQISLCFCAVSHSSSSHSQLPVQSEAFLPPSGDCQSFSVILIFLPLHLHIKFPKTTSLHCLKMAMLKWWKWLCKFWKKKCSDIILQLKEAWVSAEVYLLNLPWIWVPLVTPTLPYLAQITITMSKFSLL